MQTRGTIRARWLLACAFAASGCRSICIKSAGSNAERAASEHVFETPPQPVWESLQRALASTSCGVWPTVTLTPATIGSSGEYTIASTAGAGRSGQRCVVHFHPRFARSGYRVTVTSHEPWDGSQPRDEGGSERPELVFAVIREVEPAAAQAMLRDGQRARDEQTERWSWIPW